MRFALLVLLVVPASMAVTCWLGGAVGKGEGVFDEVPCGDASPYCFTQKISMIGIHMLTKGCGEGACTDEGVTTNPGDGAVCCKGDLCNA